MQIELGDILRKIEVRFVSLSCIVHIVTMPSYN